MGPITICLVNGQKVEFNGKYRRDLETDNWHYYEVATGALMHFRKEHMCMVAGGTVKDLGKCEK